MQKNERAQARQARAQKEKPKKTGSSPARGAESKEKKAIQHILAHPPRPPVPRAKLTGKIYGIAGIIFALLGLFFLPLIVGVIAVVCGVKAWRSHENRLGTAAIILGLFIAVLGAVQLMVGIAGLGSL